MSSIAGTTYSFYVHGMVPTPAPHTTFHLCHIPTGTSPAHRGTGDKADGCSWMGTRSATRSLAWPLEEEC